MKLVNVIFGFVIFSIVISIFFGTVAQIMELNEIGSEEEREKFVILSGNYTGFVDNARSKDGTPRGILDQTDQGVASSEEVEVHLIEGALSGGRLTVNFFVNFQNIISRIQGDVNPDSEALINPNIITGISALLIIFLAFVIISFIWRAKVET